MSTDWSQITDIRSIDMTYLQMDAEIGDPDALHLLGAITLGGYNILLSNETLAKEIALRAAARGSVLGQGLYDWIYFERDDEKILAEIKDHFSSIQKELEHLALQGNVHAQAYMGMYSFLGVTSNDISRPEWYRRAAEQGLALAQYVLGSIYHGGDGVGKDRDEAGKWYLLAARQGFSHAQAACGFMCEQENKTEAVAWYRRSAEQGNCVGQYNLAITLFNGTGVKENRGQAFKLLRQSADQGYVPAQRQLGIYLFESNDAQNRTEAAKWFRRAAEKGEKTAQFYLAHCLYEGTGITENKAEAITWYRLAAEKGQISAQYALGCRLYDGDGVEPDKAEAYKWFSLAATKEYVRAQYRLGLCYANGDGVERNMAEAIKWYELAAAKDDEDALYELGLCYYNGKGVKRNQVKAVQYFTDAAEKRSVEALYKLGQCLEKNIGRAGQDTAKAFNLYTDVVCRGMQEAEADLERLLKTGKPKVQGSREIAIQFPDGTAVLLSGPSTLPRHTTAAPARIR